MTSERIYRLSLGCTLLALLYLDLTPVLPVISGWLFIEGISHRRLLRAGETAPLQVLRPAPIDFPAESGLRLILAALLLLSVYGWPQLLWFLPWFLGFALIGAGLSGICPMAVLLRWAGMR